MIAMHLVCPQATHPLLANLLPQLLLVRWLKCQDHHISSSGGPLAEVDSADVWPIKQTSN